MPLNCLIQRANKGPSKCHN